MALTDIDQIRKVEWDQSYLWDIRFTETVNRAHKSRLTAPFTEWFPAQRVSEEKFSIQDENINFHLFHNYPIPSSMPTRFIDVDFYDDMKNTLMNWVSVWVNQDILNNGKYVTPLQYCTKELHISKLNSQREVIYTSSYLVIPTGALSYNGTDHSDSAVHSVKFAIVGGLPSRFVPPGSAGQVISGEPVNTNSGVTS